MARPDITNKSFGSNQISKPGQGVKSNNVGEPELMQYGHEGIRGALLRAGRPSIGSRISQSIVQRAKRGLD